MRRARTSAMQRDEGGRHLSKRKQLFLGCMRPPSPLPLPLLQIFNETFFRKLFSSLRKSRTASFRISRRFLFTGRGRRSRNAPLISRPLWPRVWPISFLSSLPSPRLNLTGNILFPRDFTVLRNNKIVIYHFSHIDELE